MTYKAIGTLVLLSFFSLVASAQDASEANITSTTIGHYRWYTQPWAVITGIALILIVIVALVPSNSPQNDENVNETVSYAKNNDRER